MVSMKNTWFQSKRFVFQTESPSPTKSGASSISPPQGSSPETRSPAAMSPSEEQAPGAISAEGPAGRYHSPSQGLDPEADSPAAMSPSEEQAPRAISAEGPAGRYHVSVVWGGGHPDLWTRDGTSVQKSLTVNYYVKDSVRIAQLIEAPDYEQETWIQKI